MSCAWRQLKHQTPETLLRLKRFAQIYYSNKNAERETDLYWWFEAIWQAGLTQHDRFIVWQFQNANQTRLLLTIKPPDRQLGESTAGTD
jgi:hypothetical protein